MKDSPKEYAEKLIQTFEEFIDETDFHVPKFISGVSMNDENYTSVLKEETLSLAKRCALFHIQQMYRFGDSLKLREPLMYFNAIEKEIKCYDF